jgi:hypothetical protein
LATARAAPQEVVAVAETAVTEAVAPVAEVPAVVAEVVAPAAVVTPVHYAINTCRTEAEPLETQTCAPHHERVCVTAEVVNQVPILPKVTNIGLQIFVTFTFYIFVPFNHYSLVGKVL